MRILHLVHQYPPDYMGGTELYTQALATYQTSQGHHVAVFCPSPANETGGMQTAVDEHGVQVYRVPLGTRTRAQVFKDTFRQKRLQGALRNVLQEESPNIVHVQQLMGMPMSLIDQLISANIPYVVTLHDYWYVCANAQLLTNTDQTICDGPDRLALNCAQCAFARSGRGGRSGLALTLSPLMQYRNRRLRAILEKARYVIAPTDFVRQIYSGLGAPSDHMVVIRHGIDLPAEQFEAARKQHLLRRRERPLRAGYIGSVGWQKGVHVLIEAVNALPQGSMQLTIYGNLATFPEYAAQLEDLIQGPDIRLAGQVSRKDLWAALAELDVVIIPTMWYEVSPLTIDEVFAVGIPIVASRIGAMSEKIKDGVNGRLFAVGDAAALQRVLMDILENPELLDLWQKGIRSVRTIDQHMSEIEELYQSTVDTV